MTQGEYYAPKGCYKERHIHRLRDDFWKLKIYLAKEILLKRQILDLI